MTRPTIMCGRDAVSSGHYLATQAGMEVLVHGGNAVDAGVAAGLTLAVVESTYVSLAGVAPIIIRMADAGGRVQTIPGVGWWPQAVSPSALRERFGEDVPAGVLRTVVPAAPAAWLLALQQFGTMSFGDVAQAAIGLAAAGFPVYPTFRATIAEARATIAGWPSSAAIYLPGGELPEPGALFRQHDLAGTLQFMVDEERAGARHGRNAGLERARAAFYQGDIGHSLVRFVQSQGGFLAADDLAGFTLCLEDAIVRTYRGIDVHACGAWCQGPMLLEALGIVGALKLDGLRHNSVEYLHLVAEAIRLAARDRERHIADPRFHPVPLDRLLSQRHARDLAALIRTDRALPAWQARDRQPAPEVHCAELPLDTSFVCVVDRFGNAFAATPSDGITAAPVSQGLGFVASPRGSQSWTDPSHPCVIAPGKRPRLTPNPAIAVDPGRSTVMPFGTPGHDTQTQVMLQVLLNLVHFGMSPQEAVEAPRLASLDFPSSAAPHAARPGLLYVESDIGEPAIGALRTLGHDARPWPTSGPDYFENLSAACLVVADAGTGVLSAAADPRRPAYAMGR